QSHGHAWRRRVVSHDRRGRTETVDDDIEIAVAVEVRGGHPVRDVRLRAEIPRATHVDERVIAAISEGHVPERQLWIEPTLALPRRWAQEMALQSLLRVGIHHVPQMPVPDEQILPSVEIDVHEERRPRPSTRLHTGILANLGEG